MDREIRYCTVGDGASIAYCVEGRGDLLLAAPSFLSLAYRVPDARFELYKALSKHFTLVTYDGRGMGLSDRAGADYSLEERLADLSAVAAALGAERFNLFGQLYSSPVAIAFAARHPERVSRLLLMQAYANGADWYNDSEFGRIADALRDETVEQWEFVSRTMIARGAWPGTPADVVDRRAAAMREAWTPESTLAYRDQNRRMNVVGDLPGVRAPTLVVHGATGNAEQNHSLPTSRGIASRIAGARLLVTDVQWDSYPQDTIDQILRFLGAESVAAEPRPEAPAPSGVRTVLFTDLVGHTEMMQRLGDDRGRDVLREHERITRETLKQHGGAEVKTMGDGFMASFGSVTKAMDCAIALQRAFATHTESMPEPLHVRVGLNAGEPIEEDGDLFGSTVILASRIAAKAGPGEILVPDTVRGLLSGKSFLFADRGTFAPKGFEDPVRLYEVRWRE